MIPGRNRNIGYVYIASNKGMPGLVKIGMTTKTPAKRLKELYSTGVPYPFSLHYACRVKDPREVEKTLHRRFGSHRVSNQREFFEMEIQDAVRVARRTVNSINTVRQTRASGRLFVALSVLAGSAYLVHRYIGLTVVVEWIRSLIN